MHTKGFVISNKLDGIIKLSSYKTINYKTALLMERNGFIKAAFVNSSFNRGISLSKFDDLLFE